MEKGYEKGTVISMSKIAFVFPGQGAQYVGMGKDFYDTYETAKQVIDLAGSVTGIDMEKLLFTENEQLNQTEYTQIAMLAIEVAMLKVLEEKGIRADMCAGLSLGEYGALAAAKVMELDDLFKLIRKRGLFMQEAYPEGGAMTAVLGMETATIREICEAVTKEENKGVVSIANYNCPEQIVITGKKEAVDAASERLTQAGAKRCVPLKVSGPFHSALLETAGQQLGKELAEVTVSDPVIPYYCNVNALAVTEKSMVKDLLEKQISSSVCWQQSVEKMIADGADTFIEIGPGKTLSGFMRKIDKSVRMMNVEKVEDLEKVIETLAEEVAC